MMRTAFLTVLLATFRSAVGQTTCTLCPDGTEVGNPDLIIPLFFVNDLKVTCGGLASIADLFDELGLCETNVQTHAGFCGCQGIEPVNACRLCPDGDPPAFPDKTTPLFDNCTDLDAYSTFLTQDECESEFFTAGIQSNAALCGCTGVEPECTLCPDKSPPPNPNQVLPDGFTCGQVADSYLVFNQEVCDLNARVQEVDAYRCGCEGAPEPEIFCTLCPNGTASPDPDLQLPFGLTCGQAEIFYADSSQDQCNQFEQVNRVEAELCGCDGVEEADCTLCPDGTDVGKPERQIPRKWIEQVPATCGFLDSIADVLETDCEEGIQSEKGFCGCSGVEASNVCSFCPDGSSPPDMDKETPFGNTCGEINEYVSFFADRECDGDRLAAVRLDAAFCGCQGVKPECSLCPDGSPPQSPDVLLPDNTTCQFAADLYSVASEATCEQFQEVITADAALCGCPGVEPLCSFCPDGNPPANLDFVLREGLTCGDALAIARTLTAEQCDTQANSIQIDAFRCGCEGAPLPTCTFTENPEQCTADLLATTDETCECYSFCDGELVDCDTIESFVRPECDGEAVYGCNNALAAKNDDDGDGSSAFSNKVSLSFLSILSLVVLGLEGVV